MRILLITRIDDDEAFSYAQNLKKDLIRIGHWVQSDHGSDSESDSSDPTLVKGSLDLVVIIGGDGTILRTVQQMERQIPLIGINWGEVGFLADLEPKTALSFLTSLEQNFPIEQRMRIAFTKEGTHLGDALNEALIVTTRPAKMLRFSVIIDDEPAGQFRADGLLVSTPTGSTAYAMSAGGPIIDPRVQGILLVPLAPYKLSSRPQLISSDRRIGIRLESSKPAHLVIDGQRTVELGADDVIDVARSSSPALFVDAGRNFFSKVDEKLRRL
jgi:NAD+ kinase